MLVRMTRSSISATLTLALLAFHLSAQTTPAKQNPGDMAPTDAASVVTIWPNGAPGALGTADGDVPKLYCFPAPGPGPHAAVVVLPGGGYSKVVMDKEGAVEARWLNTHGVSAYVLQYRLHPAYHYPAAMLDGERAIRLVRSHAKEWNLRKDAIGIWGFSAGGHLAGWLATADPHMKLSAYFPDSVPPDATAAKMLDDATKMRDRIDEESAHPDFAILSYARLSLNPAIPGTFGMKTLIGENAPQAMVDAISPVLHVTKETSPSFLYGNSHDATVSSLNATAFYDALQLAHVPAELHVFETGPHGTGMGQNLPTMPELAIWPTLLEHWMTVHGWIKP